MCGLIKRPSLAQHRFFSNRRARRLSQATDNKKSTFAVCRKQWIQVQTAQRLGLQGWVRNRLDGSVEALASGPADAVQALIDWAHDGPPAARVDRVDVSEGLAHEPLQGFVQRETV